MRCNIHFAIYLLLFALLFSILPTETRAIVPDQTGINAPLLQTVPTLCSDLRLTPATSTAGAHTAYGYAVATDGQHLLVGAPADNVPPDTPYIVGGSAYLYRTSDGTLVEHFTSSFPVSDGGFGLDVAIDGNTLAIAATNQEKAVYIYDYNGTEWLQSARVTPPVGAVWSITQIVLSGDLLLIGDLNEPAEPDTGTIHVYKNNGTSWTLDTSIGLADGDPGRFDFDGSTLAVGYRGLTNAYVYTYNGTSFTQQAVLTAPGNDYSFGWTASVDGDTLALRSEGSLYVSNVTIFTRTGAVWTQQAHFPDAQDIPGSDDKFGHGMKLVNQTLYAGNYSKPVNSQALSGQVQRYQYDGSTWALTGIFDGANHELGSLGQDIDATEQVMVAGAYSEYTIVPEGVLAGAVYVFNESGCGIPVIIMQPTSQTIPSGSTATLNVVATGTEPLNYQWYQGESGDTSTPVGTNSADFTPALTNTTPYWVQVSNAYGNLSSNTATLIVPTALSCVSPINLSQKSGDDYLPYVDGNVVAWFDGDLNNTEIWVYDLNTGTGPTNITQDSEGDSDPQVDGNFVAWVHYDEYNSFDSEIYIYDVSTHAGPTNLTQNDRYESAPQARGGTLVWLSSYDGDNELWAIYAYDLATQTGPTYIADIFQPVDPVRVYGNIVVWSAITGVPEEYTKDIWVYDLSTGVGPTNISQNGYDDEFPTTDGEFVVWQAQGKIWAYNLNTQTGPVNIGQNISYDDYPQVYNGLAVWSGFNGNNREIFVYDLNTGTGPTILTHSGYDDNSPMTDGEFVVWQATNGDTSEVWVYDLSTHSGPTNVSQNNYYDDLPQAADGLVVWQGETATNREIWAATCGSYPLSIVNQPDNQTIPSGTTATLSVAALGEAPLSYQWYQGTSGDTSTPVGTDSTDFTTPPLSSITSYWVQVSDLSGSVNSTTATVEVTEPPSITDEPDSQTISSGSTATLNVVATGTEPLTYQWYQGNSGDISTPVGTNSTSFTTPALTSTTSYWVRVSNAYGSADSQTATITVETPQSCGIDTVGIYRDSDFSWYLRYSNSAGFADVIFNYGLPSDISVVGDWDGDGYDTVGIYRDNTFYLKNDNSGGIADLTFAFGAPGDIPIAGDWNGDGTDTIGVYRPSSAVWFLRNSNSSGDPDLGFAYGLPNETPVAGDWNGDGVDTIGIYRDSDFSWYLRNSNSDGFAEIIINFGLPSDDAVVGDWNGDCVDTVGIYRKNEGNWYLKNTNETGIADLTFAYGLPNERGVTGHWLPLVGEALAVVSENDAATPTEEPTAAVTEEPVAEFTEEPTAEPDVERQLVTVEAGDASVATFGAWTSYASDVASGGSYLYSSGAAEDTLTLAFDGSYAELTVVNHPSLGNLVVEVDGVVVNTVSLAGEAALGVPVVVGELPAGLHTLRVYPESEGMVVAVDTFRVDGTVIALVVVVPDPTEVVSTETETPAPTDTAAPTATPDPATPTPTETSAPVVLPVLENFDEVSDWELVGNWQPQMDCSYAGACVFVPTGLRDTVSSMTYRYPIDLASVPLGWQVQWTLWQNATLSVADSVAYEVSTDGGTSWQLVGFISDVNVVWEPLALDLSSYIGQVVNLRISVNTLVALPENTVTVGYWLDEMQLTAFEPLPAETPVDLVTPTEETPVPTETPLPIDTPTEEVLPTEVPAASPTEESPQ